jgi:hypothetical protein
MRARKFFVEFDLPGINADSPDIDWVDFRWEPPFVCDGRGAPPKVVAVN